MTASIQTELRTFPSPTRRRSSIRTPSGGRRSPRPKGEIRLDGPQDPQPEAEKKIEKALKDPTPPIEFTDTSFKEIIDYIKDAAHIEIQLDLAGLKDAGVDPEQQVTKNISGVSLRSACDCCWTTCN